MTDDPIAQFEAERAARIASYPQDEAFQDLSWQWATEAFRKYYMYNFHAMGRPIIQFPSDVMAMSELIWDVMPDMVVETGIAHGGSIIHSAAQLALLDLIEAQEAGVVYDPSKPKRKVVAVDIDIRPHNREALENHPLSNRITMIEGSAIDPEIVAKVWAETEGAGSVLVSLDSMHTHDHVLGELRAYAPLTTQGSYCVVFDTAVEFLPKDFFDNRPWNPGDSPRSAIDAYLAEIAGQGLKGRDGAALDLEIDYAVSNKLVVTAAPEGFLKRNPA